MAARIAIDARLADYQRAGITTYTTSLLQEMPALAPTESFVVVRSRRAKHRLAVAPQLSESRFFTPPHHRWEQLTLPLEMAALRPDLVHSPDFVPCFRRTWRAVITVHDLAFLKFPRVLTAASRGYYGQIAAACRSADRVIAVSNNTAKDLSELLSVPPEKVRVVYEAAAPLYHPLRDDDKTEALLARHGITPGYLIFVSTIEPRKNLETLLRALAQLTAARGVDPRFRNLHLVVVGQPGWLYEGVFRLVGELGLKGRVRFVGATTPEDLLLLYNGALALAYPSLYEGFGLPPLEAMACGTPVLAADCSSLPEVVGDAGLLLPPTDVEAWCAALAQVVEDEALRSDLTARGFKRARQFSWRRAAEETLAVYREALGTT
ncbi:MAG: glycosyltransferase family 4 protein [Chloroflexi bacterium]|nr:glycosyltransferase family 4 protein [Chloroflexota bacterium]MCL5108176.1 glycosyltransferase family 4 protein [Chloroflexota bacterium]